MRVTSDAPEGFVPLSRGEAVADGRTTTESVSRRSAVLRWCFPNLPLTVLMWTPLLLVIAAVVLIRVYVVPAVHDVQSTVEDVKSQIGQVTDGLTGDSTSSTYNPSGF